MVLESGGLIIVKINLDLLNCPTCGKWQHYSTFYPEKGVTAYRCNQCRTMYTTPDFIRFDKYVPVPKDMKRPPNPKTQKRIRSGKTRYVSTLPEVGKREYGPDKAIEVYKDEDGLYRFMKVMSENDNKVVDSYIQTQGYITVHEFASERNVSKDRAFRLLEHEVQTGRLSCTSNLNSMGHRQISAYQSRMKLYYRDPDDLCRKLTVQVMPRL